jgi:hypothetical protein
MTYRAVPVASLLAGMALAPDTVVEAVALNGFVAHLPPDLLLNTDESKAVAWLAIEPAEHPWPPIPGKDQSAGRSSLCGPGRSQRHPQRAMAL